MKIQLKHEIVFTIQEVILSATLSNSNEIVMLKDSGEVLKYNIPEQSTHFLFSVKSNLGYPDGGFDINAKSTLYTLDNIVIIVNDFKRHGFIYYPEKYDVLHVWREDYHADISSYPVALFKNKQNIPHIIYSVAWNHLQIMNLDTRQVLTAAKSLIEENAEERHIEFYKNYKEDNKLPWPSSYDYFFGKLFLSPDNKKFLSSGWCWGSSDAYKVYDIEDFINSNRISDINIGFWEHENRAVCWIDNQTIAVTYNPITEDDENSTTDSDVEIHFYKLDKEKAAMVKKIKIAENIVNSKLCFNKTINSFIAFSKEIGLVILSLEGNIIFKDKNLKIDEYNDKASLLLAIDNNKIMIYEMKA
ncbi:hypothetical protein [Flavobacterium sp. FlaQc-48]|uniref:hypothetical protein n=1 Tax=Flavobacterium sp. FlaQc-48 TaxID=3374181 RepID=UPI0037568731